MMRLTGLLAVGGLLWLLARGGYFLAVETAVPEGRADLLVVLGGGWEFREITGLEWLRRGRAERVLLTGVPEPRDAEGYPLHFPRYRYFTDAGIARETLLTDGTAKNTWQEARVLRNLALQNRWRRILIVSDPPHFRRLAWVCEKVLEPAGIDFGLVPTRPNWWHAETWWRDPMAARFVVAEIFKWIYYRIRYAWAA